MVDIKYSIGHKCNLRCKHCHDPHMQDDMYNDDELLMSELNKLIESGNTIRKVLITGGEPSLYKERAYKIVEKYPDIQFHTITNGTDWDYIEKFLSYDNTSLSISWDGHDNARGFDAFEVIKRMFQTFPEKKITLSYVITNENYMNVFSDLKEFASVIRGDYRIENLLEIGLVRHNENYYNIDFDVLKDQLIKLYRWNRALPMFKRQKPRECPHIMCADKAMKIDRGNVMWGCNKFINTKNMDCNYFDNPCYECDIDTCNVCAPGLQKQEVNVKVIDGSKYLDAAVCKFSRILFDVVTSEERSEFLRNHAKKITALEIMLTNSCNLNCTYCCEGLSKGKSFMSLETIDSIIEFIKSNSYMRDIIFVGGEPIMKNTLGLLNYFIDKVIENKLKLRIKFLTNGFFYNENVESIYRKMIDNHLLNAIQVSLDGIREIHDKYRKSGVNPTFDIVMNNINEMSKTVGKYLSINTVISPELGEYLDKAALMVEELRNNKIISGYSFRMQRGVKKYKRFDMNKYQNGFIACINLYLTNKLSKYAIRRIFGLERYTCSTKEYFNYPSCSAMTSLIAVKPNGDLSPCSTGSYINELVFGNIHNGITAYKNVCNVYDLFTAKIFRRHSSGSCEGCPAIDTCCICKVTNYEMSGKPNLVDEGYCTAQSHRFEIINNSKIDLSIFRYLSETEAEDLKNNIKELMELYEKEKNSLSTAELKELTDYLDYLRMMLNE